MADRSLGASSAAPRRDRSRSGSLARPGKPVRKLCAAYAAASCKEGAMCCVSHDVGDWLKRRGYNYTAEGGRGGSRKGDGDAGMGEKKNRFRKNRGGG
eukprot:8290849-Alexandrium_andersonii.AAC.1